MSAPLILAMDTAAELCSVAVWRGGLLASRDARSKNAHSRLLLPMVDDVLRAAGLTLAEVDAVAVDAGPGSFAGVRIGVAAAHGLVIGAGGGARLVTVSSLKALAHAADAEWALPAVDARMGEVHWARCRCENGRVEPLDGESVGAPAALEALHGDARPWVGVGSGWDVHHAALSAAAGREIFWLPGRMPHADHIAALAALELVSADLHGAGEK
ncbi:MAG: tRNA (adenosine(37)-N6)-threonylcarbamoyltransferase complex dimerization subunit type 1 TsaB [Gammaproteobacteria bacterium]|nr:tRNA (adenosine(37)-N6)-threonylcarbamoyltransferase complex dimerization subunit type 1 TsaB [Gammaproteobacteria bacterium]